MSDEYISDWEWDKIWVLGIICRFPDIKRSTLSRRMQQRGRYKDMTEGTKALNELVKDGLIIEEEERILRQGKPGRFYTATEKGEALYEYHKSV